MSIEAIRSESKAHKRLEYFTKRLRTQAVDRTGETEISRNWDELDRPISERTPSASMGSTDYVNPSLPPEESGIMVTGYPGHFLITLPPVGFNAGLIMFALFGFVFAGFGIFFMLVKSGLYTELTGQIIKIQESSPEAGWLIASTFALIGCGIAMIGFVSSFGRGEIREVGAELIYRFRFLGWNFKNRKVTKREIEEIDIRGDISARTTHQSQIRIGSYRIGTIRPASRRRVSEVFIRSDSTVIRLGSHLDEPHKQWLATLLRQWAANAR